MGIEVAAGEEAAAALPFTAALAEGSELTPERDCAAVADFCDAGGKDSAAAGGVRSFAKPELEATTASREVLVCWWNKNEKTTSEAENGTRKNINRKGLPITQTQAPFVSLRQVLCAWASAEWVQVCETKRRRRRQHFLPLASNQRRPPPATMPAGR